MLSPEAFGGGGSTSDFSHDEACIPGGLHGIVCVIGLLLLKRPLVVLVQIVKFGLSGRCAPQE